MSQDIKTCELAKVYENQGYYKEAFEIYSFLNTQHFNTQHLNKQQALEEVQSGLKRMEKKMEEKKSDSDFKVGISKEKKISMLLEKWLNLLILKQRLVNFKKIKARLS
jgi:flagellin-specific chaperone FliS